MKIIRKVIIADATLVSSNVPEDDYAAYNAGTTYGLGDRAIYVVADTHWIIESLQAGNIGHTPTGVDTDTWWLKVGATNRWKMFDGKINSQTVAADEIVVTLTSATQRVDAVALANVDCATARVRVIDPIEGVIYDQTKNMVSNSGITDWWAYSFEPIVRLRDYVFTDLPPYLNTEIEITLSAPGGTAKCGACSIGLSRTFGYTLYGVRTGIEDYSIKERDAFGDYAIVERDFSKWAIFDILVPNSVIDEMQIILAGYRATPAIYIGSGLYASTMIDGFFKSFTNNIQYPNESLMSIELEGLT